MQKKKWKKYILFNNWYKSKKKEKRNLKSNIINEFLQKKKAS